MEMIKLLLAFAVVSAVAAKESDESSAVCHSPAEVQSLVAGHSEKLTAALKEIAELKAENAKQVKLLEASAQSGSVVSVTAIATLMGGVLGNVLEEQLKKTELDDQVYEKLSQSYGSMSEFTQKVMSQVSEVDYRGHFDGLKLGEKYNTLVAPHVLTATTAVKPHWDQHVQPLMDKASVQLAPHIETVKGHASTHYDTVKGHASTHYETFETHVMPELKAHGGRAFAFVSSVAAAVASGDVLLNKAVSPVFDFLADVAPKQAKFLPNTPVDRVLLMVVVLIGLYILLRVGWTLTKVGLKTTRFGTRVTLVLTKFGLLLPTRVALRLLSWVLWFSTGFYCCGLCRSKKVAKASKKTEDNQVKKVSLEEVVALLTEAKKKKKLDEAVKQACKLCKNGKAFSSPKDMEGKIVTSDVLKGALKKMGVDSKGLL